MQSVRGEHFGQGETTCAKTLCHVTGVSKKSLKEVPVAGIKGEGKIGGHCWVLRFYLV